MQRGLLLIVLLCPSLPEIFAAHQSTSAGTIRPWENVLGTWKQVFGPNDTTSLKVEPEGSKVKISYGCKIEGSSCIGSEAALYDGKPYNDSSVAGLSASFQKTGPRNLQESVYWEGKLAETIAWQLSPDGSTLTRTIHFVNPPAPRYEKTVFDRNGGPTSNDDAFIGYWKRNGDKSDALLNTFALKGDVLVFTNNSGISIERNCDGKDHPDTAIGTDKYSCHFLDAQTYETEFKDNNDKLNSSLIRKISDDGKKMVVTRKNADGKTTSEQTFEKTN
jgi:hypothetical protein